MIALLLAMTVATTPAGLDAEEVERRLDGAVAEVEELRGLEFLRPVPVRVIAGEDVRRYAERRIAELDVGDSLELGGRAYARMGLIPDSFPVVDGYLSLLEEQAGGFYDPASDTFFVLGSMPGSLVPVVMAHELTHAVEDQHYDLERRMRESRGNEDRAFAESSVHEGSATLVMMVALVRGVMRGETDPAALQSMAMFDPGQQALQAFPPALLRQLAAPYVVGASFLSRGAMLSVLGGGVPNDDIDRAYREPPRSSEQILHPEKYWGPGPRDEPRLLELGDAGRALGRRWHRIHDGVLGELNVAALLGAGVPLEEDPLGSMSGDAWTVDGAAGWGGDRWELWSRGGRDVVLLATVWDDEGEAREFAAALAGRDDLRWSRRGDVVAVVFGATERRAQRVLRRMHEQRTRTGEGTPSPAPGLSAPGELDRVN